MSKNLWRTTAINVAVLLLITILFYSNSAQGQSIPTSNTAANNTPKSSDGLMLGVNLQRTRVYNSKGLTAPKSQSWQTEKLFTLKESQFISGQNGAVSYHLWLSTGYGISHPVLADGAVYFTASLESSFLYTLDAASGKNKKTMRFKKVALSSPAIAGDFIYLGGSDGSFSAINRHTGEVKWQIAKKDYAFNATAPIVADNVLYFGGVEVSYAPGDRSDGTVHAMDVDKQQQKWMFKVKGVPTAAAISGDLIVFGDMDHQLFALNQHTGLEKWRFKADADVKSPAIMGESVYFSDESGSLYRVELKTGRLEWKSNKVKVLGAPALYNNSVFFSGEGKSVYAVDAATGNEKWAFKTSDACSSPVVASEGVYFACSKIIYMVDALTGQEKWNYKNNNNVLMSPLVSDDAIYFLDGNGSMQAVR